MDSLFISAAYAQAGAPPAPSLAEMLILPAGFLLIMYFLVIRPQQKKYKDHDNLLKQLKTGDEVVTTGGIIGRVKSIADQFVTIEIAANTAIKVTKAHIASLTTVQTKVK